MRSVSEKIESQFSTFTKTSLGRLSKAFASAAAGTLFVRISQILRELVFAYEFGVNHRLDLLLLVLALPTYLSQSVLSAVPAAIIPAAALERHNVGTAAMLDLIGGFGRIVMVTLLVLAFGSTALGPVYFSLMGHQLSNSDVHTGLLLLIVLAPFLILRGLEVILIACLNLNGSFFIPSLIPCVTPFLVSIVLLFVGAPSDIYVVAGMTSTGLLVEVIVLLVLARQQTVRPSFRWRGFDPSLRRALRQYSPVLAGTLLLGSATLIDQRSAAQIGPGSISVLYFANLVVQLPVLLLSNALGTVLLPFISEAISLKRWTQVRKFYAFASMFSLSGGLIFATFVNAIAYGLVEVLLVRGAFTRAEIPAVAGLVQMLSWQIPFLLGGQVVVQAISALRCNDFLLWGAILSIATKIILNELLVPIYGLRGIGLSTTVTFAVSMAFLFSIGWSRLKLRKTS